MFKALINSNYYYSQAMVDTGKKEKVGWQLKKLVS